MWSLVVHLVNQDLSVAGKRTGLAGARSGLFMEQIRIIREMRDADAGRGRTGKFIRPRFMVWENVPGAFSSNKGDDFRAVLEETIRVADPDAPDVPLPAKGKWPMADCWMGDGWSVAYRVLDAQFWGVPQRRRRIALVADFGGHAAPEILFVRESVCGDIAEGGAEGEETAAGVGSGVETAGVICIQGAVVGRSETAGPMGKDWRNDDISYTVDTKAPSVICAGFKHKAGAAAGSVGFQEETAPTLSAEQTSAVYVHQNQLGEVRTGLVAGTLNTNSNASGRNAPLVFDARGNGDGKTACTLTGDHQSRVTDYTAIVMEGGPGLRGEIAGTLDASYFKGPGMRSGVEREIVLMMASGRANAEITGNISQTIHCGCEKPIVMPETAKTIRGSGSDPQREDMATYPLTNGEVRRLTPLECERLQGFPDGWTDIGPWEKVDKNGKIRTVPCADSLRYKALGNSIALPPWAWLLKRLCGCYERTATMASLFDGIGGFPLIWERLNGPGSCLWASEIEDFPIAVTKKRFSEGERW